MLLWADHAIHSAELRLPVKFDYGTHGEKEIKRLFCLIGIEDIFIQAEASDDINSARIDIRGKINSMTHIRNNIIHEDATPSLTHVEIKDFLSVIRGFAFKVTGILGGLIDDIYEQTHKLIKILDKKENLNW